MSDEERRTIVFTTVLLLGASLLRLAWEARAVPPILPPEPLPAALLTETREELARAERMSTPLAPGERIDPNRDPDVELARLPGVGPALARRIVESRTEGGAFRAPTDLLRVPGIGQVTLARIEPFLALSPAAVGSSPAPSSERLDLNRAGDVELQTLPGIGPALAARIVEHRIREGPFRTADHLLDVSGIGPATLERLRPLVRVGP